MEYQQYKCIESYFYKQWGCQYPWNIYEDLDVPVCDNYGTVANMLKSYNRSLGFRRKNFRYFERLVRTKMECPPSCMRTKYAAELGGRPTTDSLRSIQIALTDSLISQEEEYLGCDMTCIIGEFGGNLGFFLGGSLLFGLDIILQHITKALQIIYVVWNRKSIRI